SKQVTLATAAASVRTHAVPMPPPTPATNACLPSSPSSSTEGYKPEGRFSFFFACFSARFSFSDFPGFLLLDFFGDLSATRTPGSCGSGNSVSNDRRSGASWQAHNAASRSDAAGLDLQDRKPVHIGCPARAFEESDDRRRGVDLMRQRTVPGRARVRVVEVVPRLAEGENAQRREVPALVPVRRRLFAE